MTAGSLPEGLVERCAEAVIVSRGFTVEDVEFIRTTQPEVWAIHCVEARAVLAVAAPALREQALRDERARLWALGTVEGIHGLMEALCEDIS